MVTQSEIYKTYKRGGLKVGGMWNFRYYTREAVYKTLKRYHIPIPKCLKYLDNKKEYIICTENLNFVEYTSTTNFKKTIKKFQKLKYKKVRVYKLHSLLDIQNV